MKTRDIVNQLRSVLLKYTDKFSEEVAVSSLTSVGTTATATSAGHGLTTGDNVLIKGAKIPYQIESLTRVGEVATAITSTSNDTTFNQNWLLVDKDVTTEITGANESDYNGVKFLVLPPKLEITSLTKSGDTITATTSTDHGFLTNAKFKIDVWGAAQAIYNQTDINVASVPASNQFTYTVEGETDSPATPEPVIYCQARNNQYTFFFEVENNPATPATGTINQLLLKNGGYNGFKQITVTGIDIFTYDLDFALNSPAFGTITFDYSSRIDGAITLPIADDSYTRQDADDYWLYVVRDPTIMSKDRREQTDAIYVVSPGDRYEQTAIYNFHLYVFVPVKYSTTGGSDLHDDVEELKQYIYKSILGVVFPSDLNEQNTGVFTRVTAISDGVADYNSGRYIHDFLFEATGYILEEDIADEGDTWAVKRIIETYVDEDTDSYGIVADVTL